MNRDIISGLENVMRLIARIARGRVPRISHLVSEGTIDQVDCRVVTSRARLKRGVKRNIQ